MKHLFAFLCWAVVLGGFVAACSKKPKPTPIEPEPPRTEVARAEIPVPAPTAPDKVLRFGHGRPPHGPIYFDFDASTLKETGTVARLAAYMQATNTLVTLIGYASQEGTDDYNLHLGARRAQAVRDYLEASGIAENRITWTSLGEENPVTDDPAQYPLNRRVEFTLEDLK